MPAHHQTIELRSVAIVAKVRDLTAMLEQLRKSAACGMTAETLPPRFERLPLPCWHRFLIWGSRVRIAGGITIKINHLK